VRLFALYATNSAKKYSFHLTYNILFHQIDQNFNLCSNTSTARSFQFQKYQGLLSISRITLQPIIMGVFLLTTEPLPGNLSGCVCQIARKLEQSGIAPAVPIMIRQKC
jgi:hypothetical protein